jgi:Poly(ADP-ribose) polymerase catalytic domain/UBA/TS-N domain
LRVLCVVVVVESKKKKGRSVADNASVADKKHLSDRKVPCFCRLVALLRHTLNLPLSLISISLSVPLSLPLFLSSMTGSSPSPTTPAPLPTTTDNKTTVTICQHNNSSSTSSSSSSSVIVAAALISSNTNTDTNMSGSLHENVSNDSKLTVIDVDSDTNSTTITDTDTDNCDIVYWDCVSIANCIQLIMSSNGVEHDIDTQTQVKSAFDVLYRMIETAQKNPDDSRWRRIKTWTKCYRNTFGDIINIDALFGALGFRHDSHTNPAKGTWLVLDRAAVVSPHASKISLVLPLLQTECSDALAKHDEKLYRLTAMGFSQTQAKQALRDANGDIDVAINAVLNLASDSATTSTTASAPSLEPPIHNSPSLVTVASASASASSTSTSSGDRKHDDVSTANTTQRDIAVQMLCEMGYGPVAARHALVQTNDNIDRAIAFLVHQQNTQSSVMSNHLSADAKIARDLVLQNQRTAEQQTSDAELARRLMQVEQNNASAAREARRIAASAAVNDKASLLLIKKLNYEDLRSRSQVVPRNLRNLAYMNWNVSEDDRLLCCGCMQEFVMTELCILQCRHSLCNSCFLSKLMIHVNNDSSSDAKSDSKKTTKKKNKFDTKTCTEFGCPAPACTKSVAEHDIRAMCTELKRQDLSNMYTKMLLWMVLRDDPNAAPCPTCHSPCFGTEDSPRVVCGDCGGVWCFNCDMCVYHEECECNQYQAYQSYLKANSGGSAADRRRRMSLSTFIKEMSSGGAGSGSIIAIDHRMVALGDIKQHRIQMHPSYELQDGPKDYHFRFAESQFHRMCGNRYNVKQVDYIVNPRVRERYLAQRLTLGSKLRSERLAFHGTSRASINGICKDGFKVGGKGVPVKNGTACGSGVYASQTPDVAFSYTGGSGQMILCSILITNPDHRDHNDYRRPFQVIVARDAERACPLYVVHFSNQ